jgi:hypothetical protein
MNFDNIDDNQNIKYQHRGIKEILKSLLETPIGIHQIFVYPNIDILREIYFHYIKRLLDNNNEIIIFLPYYETAESVKKVLSSFSINYNNYNNYNNNSIDQDKYKDKKDTVIEDVNRYINNGSLVIIDADKAFSNVQEVETITRTNDQIDKDNTITHTNSSNTNNKNNFLSLVRMSLYHINKLRKEGITIIADYGFIYNNNKKDKFEDLLELEKSIPYFFESIKIRQICLYNQNDFFHRFTKQQKKEILDLHSRSIIMMD